MTGTIHLIVEDKSDADVVRALLKAKNIHTQVKHLMPTGAQGGVSRLAQQLEPLIATALQKRQSGDCIAVLHDADEMTQPDRSLYNRIREVCQRHAQDVVLVIARDEIEAWLLADEGLCRWLGENPANCDHESRPSERLERAVKRKSGRSYSAKTRIQVLDRLDGSGNKHSPSMRYALSHLKKSPCLKGN